MTNYLARILSGVTAVLWALPAHADTLSLSGGANRTPSTEGNPTSGSNQAGLSGYFELGPRWSLDGMLNWSRPLATGDSTSPFAAQEKDAATFFLALGTTWTPGAGEVTITVDDDGDAETDEIPAHWSFSASVNASPKSTGLTSTTLTLEDQTKKGALTYDAPSLLKAASSSLGGGIALSYDTAGDSAHEMLWTLSFNPSRVSTLQTVEAYQVRPLPGQTEGKILTRDMLLQECQATTSGNAKATKTCQRLMPLLKAQQDAVLTMPVSLSLDQTLFGRTSVGLSGTWYFYDKDPNSVGYFTLASQGRKAPNGEAGPSTTASYGTGVAIAPFQWSSGVSVSHPFGPLKLSVLGGFSRYYDDAGSFTSLTTRVNWKITQMWRVSASFATQLDRDADGEVTRSFSGSMAVKCAF